MPCFCESHRRFYLFSSCITCATMILVKLREKKGSYLTGDLNHTCVDVGVPVYVCGFIVRARTANLVILGTWVYTVLTRLGRGIPAMECCWGGFPVTSVLCDNRRPQSFDCLFRHRTEDRDYSIELHGLFGGIWRASLQNYLFYGFIWWQYAPLYRDVYSGIKSTSLSALLSNKEIDGYKSIISHGIILKFIFLSHRGMVGEETGKCYKDFLIVMGNKMKEMACKHAWKQS